MSRQGFPTKRQPPFQYQIHHGSYYWYGHSGLMQSMSDEVAMVFDLPPGEPPVLLRHGDPFVVQTWVRDVRRKYAAAGPELDCLHRYWVLVEGKLDLAEVNRAISTSGYLPTFLHRPSPALPTPSEVTP